MQATPKLRWLVKQNQVTADEVRDYRDTQGTSITEALHKLKNAKPPVLQQWWTTGGQDPAQGTATEGEWRDVPVVVEPHPQG
jgi:hypothetical protein